MKKMIYFSSAILAVFTIIAFSAPYLAIFAIFSGVGLPLGVAIICAPPLLFILVLFLIARKVLPSTLPRRQPVAVAVTFLTLGLIPLVFNHSIERNATALANEDRNELILPLKARIIAVRQDRERSPPKGKAEFDLFCLHALLTGTADKVLMVTVDQKSSEPQREESAIAFRFERRPTCPVFEFGDEQGSLYIPDTGSQQPPVRSLDLVNLKISRGECLIREPDTLEEADLVITSNAIKTSSSAEHDRFKPWVDTVSADRVSVHAIDHARGVFKEIYRKTDVHYRPFATLMIPFPMGGQDLKPVYGWWRTSKRLGTDGNSYFKPYMEWGAFLTHVLGFDLALNSDTLKVDISAGIIAAIEAGHPPSAAEWKAYSEYFRYRQGPLASIFTGTDLDLGLKVLESPDFPPPQWLFLAVRYSMDYQPNTLPIFAETMIRRALDGQTWPDELGVTERQSLSILGSGIKALPDDVLKPYLEQMMQLSKNTMAQQNMVYGLARLYVFGDAAVPAMLDLVDVGLAVEPQRYRDPDKSPLLAGLLGLCRAGNTASSALPTLWEWLNEGRLPTRGLYADLVVRTMLRLGAEPEQIWNRYSAVHPKETRDNFDKLVRASLSSGENCRL